MSALPAVYLTRKAASQYLTNLGFEIKPETLARWKSTGRYALPTIKLGRLIRYRKEDLDHLIESHRVTPGTAA